MAADLNQEIREILIKKAKGFYYTEETVEFTDDGKKPQGSVAFGNGATIKIKRPRGRPKKNTTKPVTFLEQNENLGVCLTKKDGENASKQENVVVKRKITTHYVPPDMLAIKMLFENFGEKIDSFEDMSDEEILKMKRKLLEEWVKGE